MENKKFSFSSLLPFFFVLVIIIALIIFYPGPREAKGIFNREGEIVKIEENKLVIATNDVDKRYTILIGKETEFNSIGEPQLSPAGVEEGKGKSLLIKQPISLKDLKVSDHIIASSEEDIANKSTFKAKKINLICEDF